MSMLKDPSKKYRPFTPVHLPDRTWPDKIIDKAPIWLSTDLRDGNQSLIEPMDAEKKLRFFKCLVAVGLKEIEVGFPSASQTDFDFVRELIEGNHIPDDVTIQVLTQARDDLIERTFESLKGAKRAIVHYYNACAPAFRKIVFNQDKEGVKAIAVAAGKTIKRLAEAAPETQWGFEYSPEVFSSTETDFAVEVCNAVIDVFQPTPENKLILNLPATIECATPNNYADQVEWFCRHVNKRDSVIISVHTHNDRGTGVAASELAVMAGADRVEGCLFGNGERTGNVCLVTLALNLYTQGVDPKLDFSDIDGVRKVVEECNQLPVHPRHPYVGDLVHTAFSGSHQDAIRKGFAQQKEDAIWEVPYLPIDPADIGRSYEAVIRVNSQSGKGGVAYLLENEFGIELPKDMQRDFGPIANDEVDRLGREVSAAELKAMFWREYVERTSPWKLDRFETESRNGMVRCRVKLLRNGQPLEITGEGNGPLAALVHAFAQTGLPRFEIVHYSEHALGSGEQAAAIAYIQLKHADGRLRWGSGVDTNIELASVKAVLSALNRSEAAAPAAA